MKKLVVLGGGESGIGAALLAQRNNWDVLVSDAGLLSTVAKQEFESNHIAWEEGGHSLDKILEASLVVKSPGIPNHVPVITAIEDAKIPIVSEIEFASNYTKATLIGITGSNGKTTTAMLTHHLLTNGGVNAGLAGNIGNSFAKAVIEDQHEVYVLEISSFQLEHIQKFHPHIAVITNLTPDHLDRYDNSFEAYCDAKFNLIKNQTDKDHFLYDAEDTSIASGIARHDVKAKQHPYANANSTPMFVIDNPSLRGRHNAKNAMAAATIAQLFQLSNQEIQASLQTFQGAAHRLEHVVNILKVAYINDSKATNVNATFFALDSMSKPTVWIVGGVDKGNDYTSLLPLVHEKVKAIVCIGVDNQKIMDVFAPVVDVLVEAQSMDVAVHAAYELATKGDAVLLSPACASFDLFENYEDRGNQFKAAVRKL
ncbi:MAG: UDP-N-acetylmuramoyl-L-alanine--D-glutamate ligase [Bacteroidetes bacterium]|nr:UDP-N-acetylmuramoyl-L-alanine--D-glutamate ligase [Bacteroidota bacterium]MDA0888836.1 UDP-N-acetylmuramoyl-L-alanine--D-glutamate ligase [Bacteroidota bacterium]